MARTGSRPWLRALQRRWLAAGLCVSGGFGLGCTPAYHTPVVSRSLVAHAAQRPAPAPTIVRTVYQPPAELPIPGEVVSTHETPRTLPITLDTIFRLAEEQNAQIAQAREKLNASQIEQELAAKAWLPDVYAGIAYYRHEGGIQDFFGNNLHSSTGALYPNLQICSELDLKAAVFAQVEGGRKHWQTRGDLSKITYETLLEAATTYVDLLTARRGEAVGHELEKYQLDLLKRAEALRKDEPSTVVLIESIQAELSGRRQALARLRQQGDAAAAKLAYLLGLDPCTMLVPMDKAFTTIDLVDPTPALCDLIRQAQTNGPGVRELEGLLAVLHDAYAQANGPGRYLPSVQMSMGEGPFGAGPGGTLTWDNRFDLGLQVRWNLTDLCTAGEKRRLLQSGMAQTQFGQKDLQGKLALGVQESREAILSGRDQVRLGTEQIGHASETYRLNDKRVKENAPDAKMNDVLQSIRLLELAHFNYLQAVSAYNKAQVRLALLLGPASASPGNCHP